MFVGNIKDPSTLLSFWIWKDVRKHSELRVTESILVQHVLMIQEIDNIFHIFLYLICLVADKVRQQFAVSMFPIHVDMLWSYFIKIMHWLTVPLVQRRWNEFRYDQTTMKFFISHFSYFEVCCRQIGKILTNKIAALYKKTRKKVCSCF